MKILIISSDIGLTAPGIVYETIIKQLEQEYDVDIITSEVSSKFKPTNATILPSKPKGFTHLRVEKLSFQMFSRNLIDDYWVIRQMRLIRDRDIKECNAIISFISFHNYRSMMLGYRLSQRYNKPWLVYSVDAVPPPSGWGVEGLYRNAIIRFVRKYLEASKAFFSANEQMLNYQLNLLKNRPSKTGILYTPIKSKNEYVKPDSSINNPVFLFTGGVYGPRKKEAVLDGFRKFLKESPNAQIVFVGVNKYVDFANYSDLTNGGHLECHEFTNNLSEFYKKATVLLDINAFFDNDVFLSSKIVNYLPLMLPIISVTGNNSPTRNIFTDDESIIHCVHNPGDVCEAMKIAVSTSVNENKRRKYIEMFSVENAIRDFQDVITEIIG
jgi:glycosyltransferase involved in cell wall biosynthesis